MGWEEDTQGDESTNRMNVMRGGCVSPTGGEMEKASLITHCQHFTPLDCPAVWCCNAVFDDLIQREIFDDVQREMFEYSLRHSGWGVI